MSNAAATDDLARRIFAGLFGAFLGLSLLKFGNVPIMEKLVIAPTNVFEFVINCPWPIVWAYRLLGLVSVVGLFAARWHRSGPTWLCALPLVWLFWECLAGAQSVDASLSNLTLKHFAACVVCFYLGYCSLGRVGHLGVFWLGLLVAFVIVLAAGWQQHFGGLAETRRFFFEQLALYPREVDPAELKKMSSDRIFSTLFYPNALAGALVLLLPAMLAFIWRLREQFTPAARGFLAAVIAIGALGCLYWSGSKGGWLLMLCLGLVAALRLPLSHRFKMALLTAVFLAGLAGFFWKYAGFFKHGATSVSARFDYWRAALQTAKEHPVFGTGPGTFLLAYERIKRPEWELARVVHNDYLEQASDSGLIGWAVYTLLIGGSLVWSWRGVRHGLPKERGNRSESVPESVRGLSEFEVSPGMLGCGGTRTLEGTDWQVFSVWLGVLGWSLQGFFEFGLYLPALAWPAFTFLGWLLGRSGTVHPGYRGAQRAADC